MVHFEETNNLGHKVENHYPLRLLGFITTNGTRVAVIQWSVNSIDWNNIQQNFIVETQLASQDEKVALQQFIITPNLYFCCQQ
jgi:hypothetical protein